MKKNFKQHNNYAEQWDSCETANPLVDLSRQEELKKLGFFSESDFYFDLQNYPISAYANDRDFYYMHPLNGWLSKLVDDKRFIPIIFQTAPHLIPDLSVGIEDGEQKFVMIRGKAQQFSGKLRDQLIALMQEFPILILKPAGLSCGTGVCRLSLEELDQAISRIDPRQAYLISNCVANEDYSQRINPHSANTIRIYFFRPLGESGLRLFRAFHRFGTAASQPVDNVAKGGLVTEIDVSTGRLSKALTTADLSKRFQRHPDSGEFLEGFMVPDWEQKKAQIAEMLDSLFFLEFGGLDLAPTPGGLKILEVNTLPGRGLLQINQPAFLDPDFAAFCRSKGYGNSSESQTG